MLSLLLSVWKAYFFIAVYLVIYINIYIWVNFFLTVWRCIQFVDHRKKNFYSKKIDEKKRTTTTKNYTNEYFYLQNDKIYVFFR